MPHIHELYDFVVSVFIVHNDKVLLVNHPKYNKWIPMGGHIELNEDTDSALFREIQEETGLDVEILSDKPKLKIDDTKFMYTPNFVDVHFANPPHKHIALIYFARSKNNKHIISNEHSDIHWLSVSDFNKPEYGLTESIKFYCQEALDHARNFNL